nr:Asp-tRNA(Asn)/Glu-tRNA(Gln) amidotransferase subunit GatC [Aliarcobacter butzleri]
MITVDDKLIAKLEKLSSLQVDDERKEKLKSELADIINFVENLNDIDVSNIEATFSTIEGGTPLREDISKQDLELSNHILNHAPKSEDGYFIVPKIIE